MSQGNIVFSNAKNSVEHVLMTSLQGKIKKKKLNIAKLMEIFRKGSEQTNLANYKIQF